MRDARLGPPRAAARTGPVGRGMPGVSLSSDEAWHTGAWFPAVRFAVAVDGRATRYWFLTHISSAEVSCRRRTSPLG